MEMATIRSPHQARSAHTTIKDAFPELDALISPMGNQVLVQMRLPKKMVGSIIVTDESQDYDRSMIRVARVIALGPIAYKKRDSMEPWPEGAWVKAGDYVRVPSYAGADSWRIFLGIGADEKPEFVTFALFNDYDMKGMIKGDPLAVIDYI